MAPAAENSAALVTYRAALERCPDRYPSGDIESLIPRAVLTDEERVLMVLPAVAEDFARVLIVTDARVLIGRGGMVRRGKVEREAPASAVRGAELGRGFLKRLTVRVDGGRDLSIMPYADRVAERFRDELNQLVATGRPPVPPVA